jgi:hypothetical protein
MKVYSVFQGLEVKWALLITNDRYQYKKKGSPSCREKEIMTLAVIQNLILCAWSVTSGTRLHPGLVVMNWLLKSNDQKPYRSGCHVKFGHLTKSKE